MILLHEAPESTYYGTPTASINYHSSTAGDVATQASATSATSAAVSQTSPASTGSSKSNAGPIAGGALVVKAQPPVDLTHFTIRRRWRDCPLSSHWSARLAAHPTSPE